MPVERAEVAQQIIAELDRRVPRAVEAAVVRLGGRGASVGLLEAFGHSFVAGGGLTRDTDAYIEKLAAMFGAQARDNYGSPGAYSYWAENSSNPGGAGYVLQRLARSLPQAAAATGGRAAYPPRSQLAVTHYSLNDLGGLGVAKPNPMLHGHRVIWSRICASQVWEESDSAWTFTGPDWSTVASTTNNSGAGYKLLAANATGSASANNAEFTVPSDVPDGRVLAIGILLNPNTGTYTFGWSVNGHAQPPFSVNCNTDTDWAHVQGGAMVLRFGSSAGWPQSALAPSVWDGVIRAGDQVKIWPTSVPSAQAFRVDYAQIEADPPDGPLIAVPLANRELSYALWSGSFGDSDIGPWNAALSGIFGEFPGRILGVDIDTLLAKSPDCWTSDSTHLNERGHAIVAQALADALRSSLLVTGRVLARPMPEATRHFRPVGQTTEGGVAFSGAWDNYSGGTPVGFMRDVSGDVFLRGQAAGGAAPPFSTIFQLPVGYRPSAAGYWNVVTLSGGTNTLGQIAVDTNGNVVLNAGGTTLTALEGVVFPASGA